MEVTCPGLQDEPTLGLLFLLSNPDLLFNMLGDSRRYPAPMPATRTRQGNK